MPRRSWTSRLTHVLAFFVGAALGVVAIYAFAIAPASTHSKDTSSAIVRTVPFASSTDSLQQAPDFALPTLEGDTFRLSAQRGKVVVLNFWATWCSPCREEIPDFIKLQRELGAERVRFVGVALDEEGFDVVRPYADEMGINYPIVHDDGAVAAKYGGVRVVPTTFLIGPEGKVHGYAPGMVTEEVLRPRLDTLLAMVDG